MDDFTTSPALRTPMAYPGDSNGAPGQADAVVHEPDDSWRDRETIAIGSPAAPDPPGHAPGAPGLIVMAIGLAGKRRASAPFIPMLPDVVVVESGAFPGALARELEGRVKKVSDRRGGSGRSTWVRRRADRLFEAAATREDRRPGFVKGTPAAHRTPASAPSPSPVILDQTDDVDTGNRARPRSEELHQEPGPDSPRHATVGERAPPRPFLPWRGGRRRSALSPPRQGTTWISRRSVPYPARLLAAVSGSFAHLRAGTNPPPGSPRFAGRRCTARFDPSTLVMPRP